MACNKKTISVQRPDNETSGAIEELFNERNINYQYVPSHCTRALRAERGIRSAKNHIIATLCTADEDFPMHMWDELLEQADITQSVTAVRESGGRKMKITSNSGPERNFDQDQFQSTQKSLISRKVRRIPGDVMKTEEIKNPVEPSLDCTFKTIVGNITLTNSQLHTYLLHITQKLGETRSCRSSVGFVSYSVSHSDSQIRNTKTNIIRIAFVFYSFSSYKLFKNATLMISSLDKGSEKSKYSDKHGWQIHNCGCPGNKSLSDIIYMMKTYYWPPWPWLMKWWGESKNKIFIMKTYYWPPWPWLRKTFDKHCVKLRSTTPTDAPILYRWLKHHVRKKNRWKTVCPKSCDRWQCFTTQQVVRLDTSEWILFSPTPNIELTVRRHVNFSMVYKPEIPLRDPISPNLLWMMAWPEEAADLKMAWSEAAADLAVAWPKAAADRAVAWLEAVAVAMMAWPEEAEDWMMAWPEVAVILMMAWPEAAADLKMAWLVAAAAPAVALPEGAADLKMAWPEAAADLAVAWPKVAAVPMMTWPEGAADRMMAWLVAAADLVVAWLVAAAVLAVAWPEAAADLVVAWPEICKKKSLLRLQ
jgi:hypothetical protein